MAAFHYCSTLVEPIRCYSTLVDPFYSSYTLVNSIDDYSTLVDPFHYTPATADSFEYYSTLFQPLYNSIKMVIFPDYSTLWILFITILYL